MWAGDKDEILEVQWHSPPEVLLGIFVTPRVETPGIQGKEQQSSVRCGKISPPHTSRDPL